jgi:hypothetical protein
MDNAGADGDEFQQMFVPLETFDREFNTDNAVRAHRGGFSPHPRHGKFPGMVHRLREDIHFLVLTPVAVLNAHMVDAGPDAETNGLEARFANQKKFVDGEIGRENSR